MIYLLAVLLLGACTEGDLPLKENEPFAIRFSTAGIGAEIATRSTLAENVPLRILAFRRVGRIPDLSADEYVAEGTYRVEGGAGVLSPVSPLLLRAGTYDFYALTPDLTVSATDEGGGSRPSTVSVEHGCDYAVSLTESKTVSEADPEVTLAELTRHCTKLVFALVPKSDAHITAVDIFSAGLTNMTDVPVVGKLLEALPVDGATCQTSVSLTGFTAPDDNKPLELSASTVVLPRKAGAFDYQMKVKFNESDKETELLAHLPEDLAFQPGYCYTFTVKLKGIAILELTVAPWAADDTYGTDMGDKNITLTIGEWKDVVWGDAADTGSGNTTLTVSGWEISDTWSDVGGIYPGLAMTSGGWENTNWSSHADTGGENMHFNPPVDWTERPTDDTNGGTMGAD